MAAHLSSLMRRQQDTVKETDGTIRARLCNVECQRTQGTYYPYDSYVRLYDRSCLPQWIFHCTEVIFSVNVHWREKALQTGVLEIWAQSNSVAQDSSVMSKMWGGGRSSLLVRNPSSYFLSSNRTSKSIELHFWAFLSSHFPKVLQLRCPAL